LATYVEQLQPELEVNYCRLVVVWVEDPASTRVARKELGATFPFLCDHDRKVIADLDIVDTTDSHHPRIAIPYTFVLDYDRQIDKIYNGWWYVGRPTVEELRLDLRTLMSRRRDWWYGDTPPPYVREREDAARKA
jgi:peroxiredoxin